MSKRNRSKQWITFIVTSALIGIGHPAFGTGFELPLQNVTNLSTSYAGTAALAEDASTAFYNSAGLTRLKHEQIVASGVFIDSGSEINVDRALDDTGQPLGSGITKPKAGGVVPAFHYMRRINEGWVFGLSVTSPFGLKIKYRDDSLVRYAMNNAELRTMNVGPSFAYKLGSLSVGFGPDFLFGSARLDTRVNFISGNSIQFDGYDENRADGSGIGGHAGALLELAEGKTRLGLNYHSNVKFRATGEERTQIFGVPATISQPVKSSITLPERVVFSFHQVLGSRFAVMGDVQWTRWNRFQNVTLEYNEGGRVIIPELYKNGWRYALGGSYQLNDQWKFRVGGSFDKSPTRDSTRSVAIPDSDRWAIGLGGQYRFHKSLSLEFAYSYAYQKRSIITDVPANVINRLLQPFERVDGSATTKSHVAGLQINWDLK